MDLGHSVIAAVIKEQDILHSRLEKNFLVKTSI